MLLSKHVALMAHDSKRHVPRHRMNTDLLERKKETLVRLERERAEHNEMVKTKQDILLQTGEEYFFKIYSTYVKNKRVYRNAKPDVKELRRILTYVNFEIKRNERRLPEHLCKPKGVHTLFDETQEKWVHAPKPASDGTIDYSGSEQIRLACLKYIHKLQRCREEISAQLKIK